MKTFTEIYSNNLGTSYELSEFGSNEKFLVLEVNEISFYINKSELEAFVKSTEIIINHHSQCTCPPDLENKMVVYQAKQIEIRMLLSYNQLFYLKDLLKGTEFKLSLETVLNKFKIL
ncbi:hypothetical protein [Wenyingzhuangia sp. 2_MG-2023]|uniref:hypothetical protein n=1 Tax=Wenyingzhuangia sp. 2_MG-2023 TaxID=3062639 RepID=UPI0026E47299|nr:hypothetical protein [Wenyingzhuangia sp. 2_MG-2023]MDO6737407.1 hypothetical protein [Wenyingzhuangia sp. 2_MG-2023]MDO6803139.1 hypothetical protein [Wenyingzhuangia sp. 1_MG-2023]